MCDICFNNSWGKGTATQKWNQAIPEYMVRPYRIRPCPCVFLCPQEMNMYTKPKYAPERHHRRSIRLFGYDYSCEGLYFITICCHDKLCLFGEIVDGEMVTNEAGRMVDKCWLDIPNRYHNVVLHDYIVMPNHFHAVFQIDNLVGATLVVAPNISNTAPNEPQGLGRPQGSPLRGGRRETVGQIIGAFKSITTNEYIHGVRKHHWPPFDRRLWQRNYYEHIIRCGRSYRFITEYILTNPANWLGDDLYIEPVPLPSRF